jgi:hypothetical protein
MDMRKTNTLTENITATELKNHDLIYEKKKIQFWVSRTSNAPV